MRPVSSELLWCQVGSLATAESLASPRAKRLNPFPAAGGCELKVRTKQDAATGTVRDRQKYSRVFLSGLQGVRAALDYHPADIVLDSMLFLRLASPTNLFGSTPAKDSFLLCF